MKLYYLNEKTIMNIIETDEAHITGDGKIFYISDKYSNEYPVKVICRKKNEELIVISCYPIKRRN